jgi:ribosomal protein L44E
MKLAPEWRCMDCLEIYKSPLSECPNCGSKNIKQMKQLENGEMKELKKGLSRIGREQKELDKKFHKMVQETEDTNKYEQIYEDSKIRGTSYHIGFKKIVLSFWSFIFALIVIWFSRPIGLGLLSLSIIMFIWATLQKHAFKHKKGH